ncbi:cytochrome c [uncultured Aquimarina sp.]|uniref:cytochrome c n=1 Tax=uncultured Aquimarina sp. TaxID=575652 RepID=UPI002609286E|nr:cytochrome c [uncultured Aquimarina sp.]
MKTPIQLLLFVFMITLLSCGSSDDGGTTEPTPPREDPIPGKTSTYIADVKTIIDSNCLECHGTPLQNSAPMPLETFQEVVSAVNTRDLLGFISTNNAFNVMPPSDEGGRMPQATIDIVEDWIADGLLEQ